MLVLLLIGVIGVVLLKLMLVGLWLVMMIVVVWVLVVRYIRVVVSVSGCRVREFLFWCIVYFFVVFWVDVLIGRGLFL